MKLSKSDGESRCDELPDELGGNDSEWSVIESNDEFGCYEMNKAGRRVHMGEFWR